MDESLPPAHSDAPWTCLSCGAEVDADFAVCWQCGTERGGAPPSDAGAFASAREEAGAAEPPPPVTLSTTPTMEGHPVAEVLDIVTAEVVMGINVVKDLMGGLTDVFGGRSKTTQRALRDARVACLDELRREADALGANAVLGVDLDYSEISGGGRSMLFLVASGTAVRLDPPPPPYRARTR